MQLKVENQHYKKLDITPQMRTFAFEAESTAFVVCKRLHIDTDEYSFPYIAGWSSGKETKELLQSAETIQKTANDLVTEIERRIKQ